MTASAQRCSYGLRFVGALLNQSAINRRLGSVRRRGFEHAGTEFARQACTYGYRRIDSRVGRSRPCRLRLEITYARQRVRA